MKKLNAYHLYLIMQGWRGLSFFLIVTVSIVYQATTVGLNPLQLVLVGTVLEGTVLLFEIPTGVVADVYSRRLSIIIGMVLTGAGFMLEGMIPLFATVLVAQIIWGLGATFLSGASQAWIADEISHADEGAAETLGQVFLRGTQFFQVGSLIGIGLSVVLASTAIALPIVVGGALFVALGLFLALVMPENGFTPLPEQDRNSWQGMKRTMRDGVQLVRVRPVLITILAITIIFGLSSEGLDRLWRVHLLENFTFPDLGYLKPIVWFGIIQAVMKLLTLGATEIARRRVDIDSQQAIIGALLGITLLLVVSIIFFGLTTSFILALVAFWITGTLRTVLDPLYLTWINHHIESKVRATMLSINGQADAIGQIVGGPPVGVIGTLFSLRAALVAAGVILSPALALYGRTLKRFPFSTPPEESEKRESSLAGQA